MGFKNGMPLRWLLIFLIGAFHVTAVSAEEVFGPWLLHPVQPPSRLSISDLIMHLDYRDRGRPGYVSLECEAELSNPGTVAVDEQLLIVSGDAGSRLAFSGKDVSQDRLVMPLPDSRSGEMTRVSVFRLILLAGERGHLRFRAWQRLEFISATRHRVRLVWPVHRAWKQLGDNLLRVDLTPELRLSHGEKFTERNGTREQRLNSYVKSTDLEVESVLDGPRWSGALGAVPALRRAWLWGALASLVGVTLGTLGRRGWLWSVPVALLVNWALCHTDPVVQQWTYYQEAAQYQLALRIQPGLVAVWTIFGVLGGMILGYRARPASPEDSSGVLPG